LGVQIPLPWQHIPDEFFQTSLVASSSAFSTLIRQVISGEISDEDRERFDEMILDESREEEFRAVLAERFEYQKNKNLTIQDYSDEKSVIADASQNDESAWDPMVRAIVNGAAVRKMPIRRLSWNIAAAASIVVLLGLTIYFYLNFYSKPVSVVKTPKEIVFNKNDVPPGSNKATLTLGNGSTITLDSAHIGELAQQGNVDIVKTQTGKLAYTESSEKPTSVSYNTLSTPRGGQHQLILSDGTKVWLNAASSITYPTAFTGKERKVIITGEAYFEVIHNTAQPFKVEVDGSEIEDIGTHFNINAYEDEPSIKTTLIEGAVRVKTAFKNALLKPGQQAVIADNAKQQIKIVQDVNTENVIAWKEGKFRYESENIESIMRQVARWYDVEIVYRGKVNETFTGGISRQANVSELLKILEYSNKVKFEIEGKSIIVEPR
jgi:transmembrane sensor